MIKRNAFLATTLLFSLAVLFTACNRDEVQARKSIEGEWEVTTITSTYGESTQNGFSSDSSFSETGALGTFDFGDESVAYAFTRRDTAFAGSTDWTLVVEKVNSGFTKVNQSTLTLENEFTFDVQFEDGTKNAEKKAEYATFTQTLENGSGPGVLIQLSLDKK